MQSSEFQALIKTLKSANISAFTNLVDKFTENAPSYLTDLNNYDKFRTSLERSYYSALSYSLESSRFDDFSHLFNYSDKLGIFIDVSNIDVVRVISKLHVDGIKISDTGRIVELVRFFHKYNLFERNFTPEELKIVQEIKENDKLLVTNLKDLFGNASDSLIFYICKIMPYDYVVWLRDPEREFVMNPNFLKNWTDGFAIYGLSVRNLGRVEDFIKEVETRQNSDSLNEDTITLEFNTRYLYRIYEQRIIRVYREGHLVYPQVILKIKEDILNKNNYNFYSLSMVIFGGLGPEGFGFTYSTPKGEVIEVCSDQSETEAIIIQFKQYLKRKFLDKLEEEMTDLNIAFDIRRKILKYLSDIINPKDLISYYDKNSILRKIRNLLFQFDENRIINESEIEEILQQISSAISIIFKEVKLEDQFRTRMDLVANGKLKSEDIAKLTSLRGKSHYDVLRERIFLQNKPKWFFKDYQKEIRELEKKYLEIAERQRRR
ncbi:MAG: hypothetical protein KGD65_14965 [Candidatus Lokiarchaeota archaeon]|nr:hypothetical protein [Candidatus Lokiarchaeota archaeon]